MKKPSEEVVRNRPNYYLLVSIFIILLAILVITSIDSVLAMTTEKECLSGNGNWTTPIVSLGDDPVSNNKILESFCQCNTGFYWNDTLKLCENDQELRCVQTGGNWINNKCQCPEETIKWTEGFGCDMSGPEPNANTEVFSNLGMEFESEKKGIYYKSMLLVAILVLFFIILYSYFVKKRKGKER